MSEAIRLVYFDIRGLAEPVRWMLSIGGAQFTDERIPLDAWATGKRGSIENLQKRRRSLEKKAGGRSKFIAQFPILIIGEDAVITQPLSVTRAVARKYGLNGTTELEEARADEVSDLIYDLRLRAVDYEGLAFKSNTPDIVRHTVFRDLQKEPDSPEKDKMKSDFSNLWFPLYFNKLNDILISGEGEWIAGDTLTYGDFVLANFLDIAEDLVDSNCLFEFPKLRSIKEKVLAMPEIVEWKRAQAVKNQEGDED